MKPEQKSILTNYWLASNGQQHKKTNKQTNNYHDHIYESHLSKSPAWDLGLVPAALGSETSPDFYEPETALAINEHLHTVNENLLSRLRPV